MDRLIVAVALAAVAVGVALVLQRRRVAPPTQPASWEAPAQLDRADFVRSDAPWLVAVFSSATCNSCADVVAKASVMSSDQVGFQEVEAIADRDLHERYRIEAVPIVVLADSEGVVRSSFMGPVSSTHLWAALAELRDPGSVPQGCSDHDH